MKLLHTSDWHLGRTLHGRRRDQEFQDFLQWLADTITRESVDVLIVAGDVFDNTTPGVRAQEHYYRFLHQLSASPCRHTVIVGGNHDSPTFLEAPQALLRAMNIHIVGAARTDPEEETLVLTDANGNAELIVCAVPYLRDRDVRTVEAGENPEDKTRKLVEGICAHYQRAAQAAEKQQAALPRPVPIVATGHLFAAGGRTVDGDGVRELYVGTLTHVRADCFPPIFDYLALGHLHAPQRVADNNHIRYSGAPIAMGFGEAKQEKQVLLVELQENHPKITPLPVPRFQELISIRGDWPTIAERIETLQHQGSAAWLEIIYDNAAPAGDLRDRVEQRLATAKNSPTPHTPSLEVLRIKNQRIYNTVLTASHMDETLPELDVNEVFQRRLDKQEIPEEQRQELWLAYSEVLTALHEEGAGLEQEGEPPCAS